MCDQLNSRFGVNDAAKFRRLNRFYFDTGGILYHFYNRLLGLNFPGWGNFQQCQQWGIDADESINPALATTPIALWEHIKLVSDFFEFPKSFSLEF
jgi:hypothetical protein